jgi:hypothetical protein
METVTASLLAEGAEIDSKYRLGAFIAAVPGQFVYETIYRGNSAAIRLVQCEDSTRARERNAGSALAFGLAHPNLLTIYDYGVTGTDAWVVTECPDECLAIILRQRSLTEDEVRELLNGVLPPLEFLGERKLAPAHLNAADVFACGDRIKLNPCLVEAAHRSADPLPNLILEALTGSTDPAGIARLNTPFREIVTSRWEIDKIRRVLAGEPVEEAQAERVREEAAIALNPRPKYRKFAGVAIGGALGAAALCALLIRGAHHAALVQSSPQSFDTQTIPVPPLTPVPSDRPITQTYAGVSAGWAVVGGSFNRAQDAARRLALMKKEHPKLNAQVFSSSGSSPISASSQASGGDRYVIIFASGLTEAQAKKQLARVRRAGAPRGTFALRFN